MEQITTVGCGFATRSGVNDICSTGHCMRYNSDVLCFTGNVLLNTLQTAGSNTSEHLRTYHIIHPPGTRWIEFS